MAGMITPPEGDVARAVAGSNLTIVDRLRGMLIASTSPEPSAFRGASRCMSYVIGDHAEVFRVFPSNSILIGSLYCQPPNTRSPRGLRRRRQGPVPELCQSEQIYSAGLDRKDARSVQRLLPLFDCNRRSRRRITRHDGGVRLTSSRVYKCKNSGWFH